MNTAIPPIYTILALGAFRPVPETGFTAVIASAASSDLQEAITALSPRLWIPLPAEICPGGGLTVAPGRIRDFTPDGLIRTVPYLQDLAAAAAAIAKGCADGVAPVELAAQIRRTWPHLPLDLSLPAAAPRRERQESVIDDILAMVATAGKTTPAGDLGGPGSWQRQLADLLAKNMEGIFANPEFRACEAAWRGAECLIRQGGIKAEGPVALKIVPVSLTTLPSALEILAGELVADIPDLILIDMPLDNTPAGIALLEKAAGLAASLMAPTAAWITPAFFHLRHWGELRRRDYLRHQLDDPVYAKWRKLREAPDGQWLTVTGNRFLARPPYGEGNMPRQTAFTEAEPLWISPVWALGALAAQSVHRYGWPSRLTDYPEMRLTDLALPPVPEDFPAGAEAPATTEAVFAEERLRQFGEIGMTALAGVPGRDTAFLPKAAVASGESLLARMFFARIVSVLLRLRDAWEEAAEETDPAGFVAAGLSSLFAATGQETPPDLRVTGTLREEGKGTILEIAFTPPAAVSPDSRRLAFTFAW